MKNLILIVFLLVFKIYLNAEFYPVPCRIEHSSDVIKHQDIHYTDLTLFFITKGRDAEEYIAKVEFPVRRLKNIVEFYWHKNINNNGVLVMQYLSELYGTTASTLKNTLLFDFRGDFVANIPENLSVDIYVSPDSKYFVSRPFYDEAPPKYGIYCMFVLETITDDQGSLLYVKPETEIIKKHKTIETKTMPYSDIEFTKNGNYFYIYRRPNLYNEYDIKIYYNVLCNREGNIVFETNNTFSTLDKDKNAIVDLKTKDIIYQISKE